jgi:hypothetical protein
VFIIFVGVSAKLKFTFFVSHVSVTSDAFPTTVIVPTFIILCGPFRNSESCVRQTQMSSVKISVCEMLRVKFLECLKICILLHI